MFAKLTYFNQEGRKSSEVHITAKHVISVSPANPSGSLVVTTRGNYLVAQSVDQVLAAMYKTVTGI